MSQKAVILGAAGQLGQELAAVFTQRGYDVHGVTRQDLDITEPAAVEQRLAAIDPQVVVNAAAYNLVDVAEQDPVSAFNVNALAVRNIAMACRQIDAQLIHYSTDYVFDGESDRPYREDDPPHPLSAYAVSKLAGELYARAYLDHALIVRVAVVFGPGARLTPRGNFIETMLKKSAEQRDSGKPILVVNDQASSPTYAPLIAERTADLVERGARGVVHCGGGTPVSFYDYAALIFRCAGLNPDFQPTSSRQFRAPARRPRYSPLENARMAELGLDPMPPLEECVRRYLSQRETGS
jgi:dTDP-4-dehydrorhamnose reductase